MLEVVHSSIKVISITCTVLFNVLNVHKIHLICFNWFILTSKSSPTPVPYCSMFQEFIKTISYFNYFIFASKSSPMPAPYCSIVQEFVKPFDLLELVHFSIQIISNACALVFNILNLFTIWTDCHQGLQYHTTVVCNHLISTVDTKQWDI